MKKMNISVSDVYKREMLVYYVGNYSGNANYTFVMENISEHKPIAFVENCKKY